MRRADRARWWPTGTPTSPRTTCCSTSAVDAGLRPPVQPSAGRDGGRRARRRGALQERADGLRAVEAVEGRRAGVGSPAGHRDAGPARLAHRVLGHGGEPCSARRSTSTAAASTWSSRTTRTRSRRSRCAHGTPVMANYWMHNGFLQVEGEKMSKSLGNFVTINELLETEVRWLALAWACAALGHARTHYRQPIDWTARPIHEAAVRCGSRFVFSALTTAAFERRPELSRCAVGRSQHTRACRAASFAGKASERRTGSGAAPARTLFRLQVYLVSMSGRLDLTSSRERSCPLMRQG